MNFYCWHYQQIPTAPNKATGNIVKKKEEEKLGLEKQGKIERRTASNLNFKIRPEKVINAHAPQSLTNCDQNQGISWSKARINFLLCYLFVIWQPNKVWGFDE